MQQNVLPALIVFDFDGVLTDNRVLVMQDGTEAVFCSRADGLGFDMFRKANIPVIILSTERNSVVTRRSEKLRVPCLQGIASKKMALEEYCQVHGLDLARVWFVGNDLNDLEVIRIVGRSLCPSDAHPIIRNLCHTALCSRGGEGVAREIAEVVLGLHEF